MLVFFFKQKTAYEMRISDWSSDVCSSDLIGGQPGEGQRRKRRFLPGAAQGVIRRIAAAAMGENAAGCSTITPAIRARIRGSQKLAISWPVAPTHSASPSAAHFRALWFALSLQHTPPQLDPPHSPPPAPTFARSP